MDEERKKEAEKEEMTIKELKRREKAKLRKKIKKEVDEAEDFFAEDSTSVNPYIAGRSEKELKKDRADQAKAREAIREYVNPQFAEKEKFKSIDSTEKQLGGFRPGTKLYSSERTELSQAQKSNLTSNPKNPMTIVKPLMPNILDAKADERERELKAKRTGKWVIVNQK